MSQHSEFEGLTALVIEDELFMRNLLMRLLQELGFSTVHVAEDGAAALQRLETSYVDVITLGLDMPLVDGFDFLRMLRSDAKVRDKDTPVVVVTSNSEGRSLTKAVELGVHGFVVKPVSKKTLAARLSRALKREKVKFADKPVHTAPIV